jgi:hypothetical protein
MHPRLGLTHPTYKEKKFSMSGAPVIHWIGRWVGPKASVDKMVKGKIVFLLVIPLF